MTTALSIIPLEELHAQRIADAFTGIFVRAWVRDAAYTLRIQNIWGPSGVVILPEKSELLAGMLPFIERYPNLWMQFPKELWEIPA